MKLIIDNREKALSQQLARTNVEFEIQQLELGDMILCDDEYNHLIIIERKTVSDLASSIMDGRYKEQSFRLSNHTIHNHNIIYLIEGDILNYKSFSRIQNSTIYSSILTLSYFKGFSVLRSKNIVETALILEKFINKLTKEKTAKGYYDAENKESCTVYSDVVKCEKKSNITEGNIYELMLSQIPYVSSHIAREILKAYSFKDLVNNINTVNLSELKIVGKNGNERKISKNVVENLKKYLQ